MASRSDRVVKWHVIQKRIKVSALKIGMNVVLPASWFSHPFLKSSFAISSQEEIDKIIECGFDEVMVRLPDEADGKEALPAEDVPVPPKAWMSSALIPPELSEAIHDRKLNPEKKAKVVYASSLKLMERLLQNPSAENIGEAKKGVAEIVDLIVSDTETSESLLKITSHDYYTYTHSVNVGVYAIMLAKTHFRGSDGHDMHELGAGFFLHDIGKVHIDPAIINKPGRLTDSEMGQMRSHPYQGYKILSETAHLTDECRAIVMEHHERDDGLGYPRRLKGNDIHVYGRICSVADVFDALTAERSYKQKKTTFESLRIMRDEMLNHFHRDLFEEFVLLFSNK
ncbi:MAG: HD-GYP domain-containing protein [Nitrospirae bacterium]|nr:HD-GYP domain-containing protein [Nitrospirota bacterium]